MLTPACSLHTGHILLGCNLLGLSFACCARCTDHMVPGSCTGTTRVPGLWLLPSLWELVRLLLWPLAQRLLQRVLKRSLASALLPSLGISAASGSRSPPSFNWVSLATRAWTSGLPLMSCAPGAPQSETKGRRFTPSRKSSSRHRQRQREKARDREREREKETRRGRKRGRTTKKRKGRKKEKKEERKARKKGRKGRKKRIEENRAEERRRERERELESEERREIK